MSYADDMIEDYLGKLFDAAGGDPPRQRKKRKGKPYHRWSAVRKARAAAKKTIPESSDKDSNGDYDG